MQNLIQILSRSDMFEIWSILGFLLKNNKNKRRKIKKDQSGISAFVAVWHGGCESCCRCCWLVRSQTWRRLDSFHSCENWGHRCGVRCGRSYGRSCGCLFFEALRSGRCRLTDRWWRTDRSWLSGLRRNYLVPRVRQCAYSLTNWLLRRVIRSWIPKRFW